MLRVEGIFLGQLDTVAFNAVHNTNVLAVSVNNFHMFADIIRSLLSSQYDVSLTLDDTASNCPRISSTRRQSTARALT